MPIVVCYINLLNSWMPCFKTEVFFGFSAPLMHICWCTVGLMQRRMQVGLLIFNFVREICMTNITLLSYLTFISRQNGDRLVCWFFYRDSVYLIIVTSCLFLHPPVYLNLKINLLNDGNISLHRMNSCFMQI